MGLAHVGSWHIASENQETEYPLSRVVAGIKKIQCAFADKQYA
jgi:hypothetical protein